MPAVFVLPNSVVNKGGRTAYDPSGVFVGSNIYKVALELGASGDEFTTNSAIDVLDANDNVIITACGTSTGTRFGGEKEQAEN